MPAFLTDDWFTTVEKLTAEAGDLNLPAPLANLALNLVVVGAEGNTELALDAGKIQKGLSPNATTTLNMDAETLRKAFLEFEENGRMKPSSYYRRIVDVMEELYKFTLLTRGQSAYLTDRYSERVESAEELSKHVNQKSI